MANISIHLNCVYDWDRIKVFLAQDGIHTALLLNANAEQIQYALDNVDGIVTVRVFDPWNEYAGGANREFEKDIILRHKPADFVQWINSHFNYSQFKGNKRVRFILGWNEMFYAGGDYQRSQNRAMIATAKALIEAGYGVAMFGLAADKTLQITDMNLGVWDEVIEFADEFSDWAHIDVHEYEVGRLASQHLKVQSVGYPDSMIDPHAMRQENWGTIAYEGDGIYSNWHIGRVAWLLVRAEKLGKQIFWARGECGWDFKDDGKLRAFIANVFSPQFGRPSGANTLRPLITHLLGAQSLSDSQLDDELWKDLEWIASQDPPNCLQNIVFCWHNHSEHRAFNLAEANHARLRLLMGKQNGRPSIPPMVQNPPINVMQAYTVQSLEGNVLLRNAPNASGTSILGRVTVAPVRVFRALLENYTEGKYPKASGHPWEYLYFPEADLYAWIASDLVKFTAVNPPPANAEIEKLRAELLAANQALAEARAKLASIKSIVS